VVALEGNGAAGWVRCRERLMLLLGRQFTGASDAVFRAAGAMTGSSALSVNIRRSHDVTQFRHLHAIDDVAAVQADCSPLGT